MLETATRIKRLSMNPTIESNSPQLLTSLAGESAGIAFTIPLALEQLERDRGLIAVPIDTKNVPAGLLFAGQLRLRTLPVAAAKFVEETSKSMGG